MKNMEYDAIYKILDKAGGDVEIAAANIYQGSKKLAMEVIILGVTTAESRRRRVTRREFKRTVQPKFKRNATTGSVSFTPQFKKKMISQTQKLFGPNGWKIGRFYLADFTRDELLTQAEAERKAAKGHVENAEFYEALAEPMKPGETVREHWKAEDVMSLKDEIQKRAKTQRVELI